MTSRVSSNRTRAYRGPNHQCAPQNQYRFASYTSSCQAAPARSFIRFLPCRGARSGPGAAPLQTGRRQNSAPNLDSSGAISKHSSRTLGPSSRRRGHQCKEGSRNPCSAGLPIVGCLEASAGLVVGSCETTFGTVSVRSNARRNGPCCSRAVNARSLTDFSVGQAWSCVPVTVT